MNNTNFRCTFAWFKLKGKQTCFSPRCVSAEHSIYLTALILLASFCPCSRLSGDRPCSDKALNVSLSSLKSILVPTRNTKNKKHFSLVFFSFLRSNSFAYFPQPCQCRWEKTCYAYQLKSSVHLGSDVLFLDTISMWHFQMKMDCENMNKNIIIFFRYFGHLYADNRFTWLR